MAMIIHLYRQLNSFQRMLKQRKKYGIRSTTKLAKRLFGQFLTPVFLSLIVPGMYKADADPYIDRGGEFSFVRLQYDTRFGGDFRMNPWATDFPAADINFLKGVTRLTSIKVNQEPIVLRLDDDAIFDHPFLYAVEMGRSGGAFLTLKETENLREYLLRGGFLLVDDFWGTYQWDIFERVIQQVFPDRKIVRLPDDHDVFHGFYDVPGAQMIPALGNGDNRPEADVEFASNHAIFDDDGRMMVLINWNSDMGDGWEHTYHNDYPVKFANQSYQLGINFLIYALTH